MTDADPDKVQGKGYEDIVHKEAQADGTVTPGSFLEYSGAGPLTVREYDEDQPTGAAARVAVEPSPPRDSTNDPIDEQYADSENVRYRMYRTGDEIKNARLAAGQNIATSGDANIQVGERLAITNENNNGVLKSASTNGAEVAMALEAVDNSGSSSVARISVEVL